MQILRISARVCGVRHPELSAIPADGRDVMVRLFIDATESSTPPHSMETPLPYHKSYSSKSIDINDAKQLDHN